MWGLGVVEGEQFGLENNPLGKTRADFRYLHFPSLANWGTSGQNTGEGETGQGWDNQVKKTRRVTAA